jgi:hypothetical protein|tara:strand:+ start:479 stop:634 length:156 start_codon:yes stop_codon:yes gene_type:complete
MSEVLLTLVSTLLLLGALYKLPRDRYCRYVSDKMAMCDDGIIFKHGNRWSL